MPKQFYPVDIIIPIYNAFSDLNDCINSIKKWTDLSLNRLILINDNSSDEKIKPYLDSLASEQIKVIHNEVNQGFSANINIGMNQSKTNDVLLLNSDTVVTKNWIDKILACAYSDPSIGTVTPLSNNATLCSVPIFCEENIIPQGYSLDEYADLIEKYSMKQYPEIPVGHGFCLFAKRSLINAIGNFDAKTFEKGYGEENDFCYRAIEAGYHHVMCDDTFILHTGTKSFINEEKQKLINEHERILDERYPELMQNVRVHCANNPNRLVQENIQFWTKYNKIKRRPTILYLVQADFREDADDHVGGTQFHVKDLTMNLRNTYDIVVAARNKDLLNVTLYTEESELLLQYFIDDAPKFPVFRSKTFHSIYTQILKNFQIDLVHIHHTKDLTYELFYAAENLNIPVYLTIHDYFMVCPKTKLLDHNYHLCSGYDNANCSKCIQNSFKIAETVPYISIWKSESENVLKNVKCILGPSESSKDYFCRFFPDVSDKFKVIEHGSDDFETEKNLDEDCLKEDRKMKTCQKKDNHFHVAFVGGISIEKGYNQAVEMIRKSNSSVEYHLFGSFYALPKDIQHKKNFVNHGPYDRNQLHKLFQENHIDLICILPIWPETFCYTLSEAILCDIPVLALNMGAVGDRCKANNCGWLLDSNATTDNIVSKVYEIKQNTEDYLEKKQAIKNLRIDTVSEMCEKYNKLYDQGLEKNTRTTQLAFNIYEKSNLLNNKEWILEGLQNRLASQSAQYATPQTCKTLSNKITLYEAELAGYRNSYLIRIVMKICKKDFFLKKIIGNTLRRIKK